MVKKKIGRATFSIFEGLHYVAILSFYMGYLKYANNNIISIILLSWLAGIANYLTLDFYKAFKQNFSFEYEALFICIIMLIAPFWLVAGATQDDSQLLILFIIMIISMIFIHYKPYYTLYILLAIYILLLLLYAILMKEKTILSFLEMLLVWAISYLSFYIAFKKTLPKMEMHIDMAGIPFLDRLLSRKKS